MVVTVAGLSMAPTYRPGDRLVVSRTALGRVRAGDVVVLRPEAGPGLERFWLVKRVAAAGGDPVPRDTVPALADVAEAAVPDGRLVLVGDNPVHSSDSKQHGYFDARRLVGRVVRPAPTRRCPAPGARR